MGMHTPFSRRAIEAVAAESDVAPQTLAKALRGEPIRGRAGDRARAAAAMMRAAQTADSPADVEGGEHGDV